MSRSKALFQTIVESAKAAAEAGTIKGWMASCPAEDEILDWKAGDAYTRARNDDEPEKAYQETVENRFKAVWSKYCSAYGNTSGGVLVFGLGETKKRRDRPSKLKLCFDVEAVKSRLLTLTQSNCEPPVPHIEVEAIPVGEEGKGLLICHIPESLAKPHKSTQAESPDFFIRVHDGCFPCPVSLLRGLFLTNSEPRLEVELSFDMISSPRQDEAHADVSWRLRLLNEGGTSIRDLRIFTEVDYPWSGNPPSRDFWIGGPGTDWASRKIEAGPTEIKHEPLHPGDASLLYGGSFRVAELPEEATAELRGVGIGLSITASASDMRKKKFLIHLSYPTLMNLRKGTVRFSVDVMGETRSDLYEDV